ncbi:hypothetical protein A0H81_02966 [Grifola frondosa]|uniref:Zn(2)-C6 fungal-type domain-containing protein n=1 Tax=Grifola frondosa TaxID=5627 RepID=A0A1C7MK46_GRIFR|nr:hypothetical protein A0H81_02966 [Grifola frondosa]
MYSSPTRTPGFALNAPHSDSRPLFHTADDRRHRDAYSDRPSFGISNVVDASKAFVSSEHIPQFPYGNRHEYYGSATITIPQIHQFRPHHEDICAFPQRRSIWLRTSHLGVLLSHRPTTTNTLVWTLPEEYTHIKQEDEFEDQKSIWNLEQHPDSYMAGQEYTDSYGFVDDNPVDVKPRVFDRSAACDYSYEHASSLGSLSPQHPGTPCYEAARENIHNQSNESLYYEPYAFAAADTESSQGYDFGTLTGSPIAPPSPIESSIHCEQPPPFQHNRSYTLAAAIAPLSPRSPYPESIARHTAEVSPKREPSPPHMDYLRAPDEQPVPSTSSSLSAPPAPSVPARRPRGRPRKKPLPVCCSRRTARSVNYPYPQFPPLPTPSAPPPFPRGLQDALTSHVPMSLDEVAMPDREDRPGQAIFKLNAAGAPKEPVKKKPIMACLFCRERKIACGPPVPGGPDQRCNQCARRGLVCEYPKESRRGQHKRGPRSVRIQALTEAAADKKPSSPSEAQEVPAAEGDTDSVPSAPAEQDTVSQLPSPTSTLSNALSPTIRARLPYEASGGSFQPSRALAVVFETSEGVGSSGRRSTACDVSDAAADGRPDAAPVEDCGERCQHSSCDVANVIGVSGRWHLDVFDAC